jgi:hypothetical protein
MRVLRRRSKWNLIATSSDEEVATTFGFGLGLSGLLAVLVDCTGAVVIIWNSGE